MCGRGGRDPVATGVGLESGVVVAAEEGDGAGETRAATAGWGEAARPSLLNAKAAPATASNTPTTTTTSGQADRRRRRIVR